MNPWHALAAYVGVKPATVRQWVSRGRLARMPDGSIDLDSLNTWAETRDTSKIPMGLRVNA